jgi:ABC-2 type transport system permease protein
MSIFYPIQNPLGLWTLCVREVNRFTKIIGQTVIAPLITTLLYYMVFAVAMDNKTVNGVPYLTFLVPGLIIMSMTQNAFTGTSSSLVISKIQGNIVDTLMTPLSPMELVIGYAAGGVVRGLIVGCVSVFAVSIFSHLPLAHPLIIFFYGFAGSLMLALLGIIGGIWANRFDHLAVVQNFIVGPATFLSGTFYSISRLPEKWQIVCHLNPFFYMIDGFRYGFTGVADSSLAAGPYVMIVMNAVLLFIAWRLFATGYRLKS